MGVTAPSPLSSPPGASRKWTFTFFWPLSGKPTHGALPSPRPWVQRLPPRRQRHRRTAMGNHRPSAPTPMPLTGTAAPGTGSGSGVGAGQQQSDPSMEPDILSYGRRPPPPSNLGGQSHSNRLSCDSPPLPSPWRHRRAAWPAVGDRCPLALDADAGAPGTRPPLPAPGGKVGDGTPVPPGQDALSGNFFKKSFPGNSPRMGPAPKNFKTIFDGGITWRRQAYRYPLEKRVQASVACWRFDQVG
jgi:hypothetical protein